MPPLVNPSRHSILQSNCVDSLSKSQIDRRMREVAEKIEKDKENLNLVDSLRVCEQLN